MLIKASAITNASGITFTNDESGQWDSCIATINLDAGADNWYEYDFSNMTPGQSVTVQWSQLTKADGTAFNPSTATKGSPLIELSCDLGAGTKTEGFALFQY